VSNGLKSRYCIGQIKIEKGHCLGALHLQTMPFDSEGCYAFFLGLLFFFALFSLTSIFLASTTSGGIEFICFNLIGNPEAPLK